MGAVDVGDAGYATADVSRRGTARYSSRTHFTARNMNRRCALAVFLLTSLALGCASTPKLPDDAGPETWFVVYGQVRGSSTSPSLDGPPIVGASVRSSASGRRECDSHAHLGSGQPQIVRTDGRGMYRHVVTAKGYPECVQVSASSAEGQLNGTSTVTGIRFRLRDQPADSMRVDVEIR